MKLKDSQLSGVLRDFQGKPAKFNQKTSKLNSQTTKLTENWRKPNPPAPPASCPKSMKLNKNVREYDFSWNVWFFHFLGEKKTIKNKLKRRSWNWPPYACPTGWSSYCRSICRLAPTQKLTMERSDSREDQSIPCMHVMSCHVIHACISCIYACMHVMHACMHIMHA